MKIGIINHRMGNIGSVRRAMEDIGVEVIVAEHPSVLYEVDRIILPGVGAFKDGMGNLRDAGWVDVLQDVVIAQRKPMLGICLGMQMLATSGDEGGLTLGLGFVPGRVQKLDTLGCKLRIPHVGWNEVSYKMDDLIFNKIPDSSDFYFVHSYAFVLENKKYLIATAPYGCDVSAVIRKDNVFGCQFHPEKSSKAGRQLLKNFIGYSPC